MNHSKSTANSSSESSGGENMQRTRAIDSPDCMFYATREKAGMEDERIHKLFPKCRPRGQNDPMNSYYPSAKEQNHLQDSIHPPPPPTDMHSNNMEATDLFASAAGRQKKLTNPFLTADMGFNSASGNMYCNVDQVHHRSNRERNFLLDRKIQPTEMNKSPSGTYKSIHRHLQNPFLGTHMLNEYDEELHVPLKEQQPAPAEQHHLFGDDADDNSLGALASLEPLSSSADMYKNSPLGKSNSKPVSPPLRVPLAKENLEDCIKSEMTKRRNKSVAVVSDGEVVIFEDSWYNLKAKPEQCDGHVYKENYIEDPVSSSPERINESGGEVSQHHSMGGAEGSFASAMVMEYSESPRRIGAARQAPRPGFPLRIVAPTTYQIDTEKSINSVNGEEEFPNPPARELEISETGQTTSNVDVQENDEDNESTINVMEHAYNDTGLSVRDGDYPVPTSTFDYLYEFSETRKVLEEFFKCPTFELGDDEMFADKLSESDSEDIRYDFREKAPKSPLMCSIRNIDAGSPTDGENLENIEENDMTDEVANEADVEDELAHDEMNVNHSRLEPNGDTISMDNHAPSSACKANNATHPRDNGYIANGQHLSRNEYFRYSPETTDSCGELESLSGEFNTPQPAVGYHLPMRQNYASMPVLEDGLSSGHNSDAENNNVRNSRKKVRSPNQMRAAPPLNSSTSSNRNHSVLIEPSVDRTTENHSLHLEELHSGGTGNETQCNQTNNAESGSNIGFSESLNLYGYEDTTERHPLVRPNRNLSGDNVYLGDASPISPSNSHQMPMSKMTSDAIPYHSRSSTTVANPRDENLNVLESNARLSNINSKIFKNTDPGLESLYSINKFQSKAPISEVMQVTPPPPAPVPYRKPIITTGSAGLIPSPPPAVVNSQTLPSKDIQAALKDIRTTIQQTKNIQEDLRITDKDCPITGAAMTQNSSSLWG